ncbi:MAG: TIM barrel protein [Alsobacter sp.]
MTTSPPAQTGASPAGDALAGLAAQDLRRLVARIERAPLYAHAYAFHLNMRFGGFTPADLARFAAAQGLAGLKIHVEDGEAAALLRMDAAARRRFRTLCEELGLRVDVETSSTAVPVLAEAIDVARDVGADMVRCYPRYAGPVSSILRRVVADLRQLRVLDPAGRLLFALEQHEDLRSEELVAILREVADPHLSLLFDFGNMINAYETPERALGVMAAHVTDVHVKDVVVVEDRGGWGHRACRSGEGEIDFHGLLARLLLLGDEVPQVRAIALEEENGLFCPAYRFPGEAQDPVIPERGPSLTELSAEVDLPARLAAERADADRQVLHVRGVLAELKAAALGRLSLSSPSRSSA